MSLTGPRKRSDLVYGFAESHLHSCFSSSSCPCRSPYRSFWDCTLRLLHKTEQSKQKHQQKKKCTFKLATALLAISFASLCRMSWSFFCFLSEKQKGGGKKWEHQGSNKKKRATRRRKIGHRLILNHGRVVQSRHELFVPSQKRSQQNLVVSVVAMCTFLRNNSNFLFRVLKDGERFRRSVGRNMPRVLFSERKQLRHFVAVEEPSLSRIIEHFVRQERLVDLPM